jgi:GAF domain-containing protein
MLRDGMAIGSILLRKAELGGFTSRQIDLLETFAAQAVIAIENVRLFTALQARNQDLTVALDQQTATSDILRVISGSQTDIQPVFDAIVRSAVRSAELTTASPPASTASSSTRSPRTASLRRRGPSSSAAFPCGRPWRTCSAGPP